MSDARNTTIAALDDAVRLVGAYTEQTPDRDQRARLIGDVLPDLRNVRLAFERATAPDDTGHGFCRHCGGHHCDRDADCAYPRCRCDR